MSDTTMTSAEQTAEQDDEHQLTIIVSFLRSYMPAIIGTAIVTVVMVFVGMAMAEKDGAEGFAQHSADLLRDRLPVAEHIASLRELYWLPDDDLLIANLHDGSFEETTVATLSDDQATHLGLLIDEQRRSEAGSMECEPVIIDLLFALHDQQRLLREADGRLAIPRTYRLTTVTQFAGMRIYSDNGLKTFQRDLPITATLIGLDHPAYDDHHRVAALTTIER